MIKKLFSKRILIIFSCVILAISSALIFYFSCDKKDNTPCIETVIKELDTNAIITQAGYKTWQADLSNTNVDILSNSLINKGFTKLNVETISALKEKVEVLSYDNSLTYLYQKGNDVKVLWDTVDGSIDSILHPNNNTDKGEVLFSQIGVKRIPNDIDNNPGIGMCYIYKLSDGRAVIIDGGFDTNSENIYNSLKKLGISKKNNGKFDIAAWILTHGHIDHYGAIVDFAYRYSDFTDISYLIYSFQLDLKHYYPNAIQVVPHAGLKYYVGNLTIEMLYSPEFITDCDYENDLSLIFITKINDSEILITGDAGERAAEVVWNLYDDSAFEVDILQIPHHGFFTGPRNIRPYDWVYISKIYNATNAKYGLLPMGTKLEGNSRNGRWTVMGEFAYSRTHTKFLINNTGLNNNKIAYSQKEYEEFVNQVKLGTAKFDTCNGYNGINKITSASGLVTYIMASETEDMATVFSLSSQSINVIINTTLNEWLNN